MNVLELTTSSASMVSNRPSSVSMSLRCAVSSLDRFSFSLKSPGALSFKSPIATRYSSLEEEMALKDAVTFQGFEETYNRGESMHRQQKIKSPLII